MKVNRRIVGKGIALLLAIVMTFALAACTAEPVTPGSHTDKKSGTVLSADDELSIVVGSHVSWPYDENWVAWKYFREAVGGKINITAIPNSEILTKMALMMASPNELPDLIHAVYKGDIEPYAKSGALIAIDDYQDKMPNYTKFWNSVPEEERKQFLQQRVSGDGKTYYPQVYGSNLVTNLRTWIYRKDIFDINGLKTPETIDEMYETAVKLKKLYPDSYPICIRNGLDNIGVLGPQWKPYFTYNTYYDYNNKKWCYGAAESTMLEVVEYFNKLRVAQLIPPDYLTISGKSWEELVSTDRGFMMPEYIVRIDFFNTPNRENNPKFTLAAMKAPRANTAAGQNKIAKLNMDPSGYVICNTGKKERIENAIKVVDWMYSDAACELLSWGKEGDTYTVTNGKRSFILDNEENATSRYGLRSYGLCLRADPAAVSLTYTDEQMSYIDLINENMEDKINPKLWLSLNDEEAVVANELGTAIDSFVQEKLSKFLLGQTPMSEWDAFQKELVEMGTSELLKIYASAYERACN